jgi:hypothetical protein
VRKLNYPFVPSQPIIAARGAPPQPLQSPCGSVSAREEERMSFVSTQPEALTAAARHLAEIGLGTSAGPYAATEAANAIAAG